MKTPYQQISLKGFTLENGIELDLKLAYQTYGKLNESKDNVILFPTHFAGKHTDNEWLIGDGKALDTRQYFIIVPNLFGNGISSSPSNTSGKYAGSDFPQTTVLDNIKAQKKLLENHFGIDQIELAIGWSLGATQVFFWASVFPKMVKKMIAIGGASQCPPHFQLITDTAISALKPDKGQISKRNNQPSKDKIRLFCNIYCPWVLSPQYFKEKLYTQIPGVTSLENFIKEGFENAFQQFAPNDLIHMLETGKESALADHLRYKGSLKKAMEDIKAKVLLMPGSTDLLFPVVNSQNEAHHIPDARLTPIPSKWGHLSGIGINREDNHFIGQQIKKFLNHD